MSLITLHNNLSNGLRLNLAFTRIVLFSSPSVDEVVNPGLVLRAVVLGNMSRNVEDVLVKVDDSIDALLSLLLNTSLLDIEHSLSHLGELLLLLLEAVLEDTRLDDGKGLAMIQADVSSEFLTDHVSSPIDNDALGEPLVQSLRGVRRGEASTYLCSSPHDVGTDIVVIWSLHDLLSVLIEGHQQGFREAILNVGVLREGDILLADVDEGIHDSVGGLSHGKGEGGCRVENGDLGEVEGTVEEELSGNGSTADHGAIVHLRSGLYAISRVHKNIRQGE